MIQQDTFLEAVLIPIFSDTFFGSQFRFGTGCASTIASIPKVSTLNRILIVTDKTLVDNGVCDAVTSSLTNAGISFAVFDDSGVEPSTAIVDQVVKMALLEEADGLVAIGGGSVMDLAKLSAVVCCSNLESDSYFGFDLVDQSLPVICVPTTAGTGSEVSHAAILYDEKSGIKKSVLSERIRPAVAVVDPSLTESCPKKLVAESGIDALTHAIEAFLVTDSQKLRKDDRPQPYAGKNPIADLFASQAIELISRGLEENVNNPTEKSREAMSLGASLAGMAFSNAGVTLVHALEYPVGCKYKCSHGIGNGILLPAVLEFIADVRSKELDQMAGFMNLDNTSKTAIDRVREIRLNCGLPTELRQVGATEPDLPSLADTAFSISRLIDLCPRPVDNNDLQLILQNSL